MSQAIVPSHSLRTGIARLARKGSYAGDATPAFDFFIDSVAGSDGNPGTFAAPWSTIGKLTSAGAYATGKRIGLKRTSKWRENTTVTAANVVFGSYGTGPMPCLDGSDVLLNASFTKTGGLTNVYQISFSHSLGTSGNFLNVWCNGVRLQWVASNATCDSTPGSFTPSTVTANPVTVFVHPPGSTNPISDGKLYEGLSRGSCISTSQSGLNVSGLWLRRCTAGNGVLSANANAVITGNLFEDGNKHLAFWANASVVTGNVFWKMENPASRAASASFGVTYADNGGTGATISGNYCVNDAYYALIEGFLSHNAGNANNWGTINYSGNYYKNLNNAVNGTQTNNITLNSEFARQCVQFCGLTTGVSIDIDYCTHLHDSGGSHSSAVAFGAGVITVDNSRFAVRAQPGGSFAGTTSLAIRNTSLRLHSAAGGGTRIVSDTAAPVTITDCVTEGYTLPTDFGAGRVPTASGNVHSPTAIQFRVNGVTYASIATLQAAFPACELNSVEIADAFSGDPHLNDWTLPAEATTGGRNAGGIGAGAEPDWAALAIDWSFGYLGINGEHAPAGWTPASLTGLGLWVRASDFTIANAAQDTWADRASSGAGVPTAPGGNQPAVVLNVLNGKPGVAFTQDYFTGSIIVAQVPCTLFCVASLQSTAGSSGRVLSLAGTGSDTLQQGYHLRRDAATAAVMTGTNSLATVSQAVAYGAPFSFVGGKTTTDFTQWLNGVAGAAVATTLTMSSTRYVIGARADTGSTINASTNGWADYIFEVGVVKAALSNTDREKLEGYLHHHWGIASALSNSHPYKNAAPTV